MAAWRFPAKHAQTKAMIAKCAASGVGIDYLPDAPRFRFVPHGDAVNIDPYKPARQDGPTKPSARGSVACGKPAHGKLKNWTPDRISLAPQYDTAMTGDDWDLTKARRAYHRGDPKPLRDWLRRQAATRATEQVNLPYQQREKEYATA